MTPRSHAQGDVLKDLPPGLWLDYLETIVSEEVLLPGDIAGYMLREFARPKDGTP
ncbi:hypothetical protein [Paenibacillus methanolicus]|uniref:Uncharacterized protein n=1 Tax=Paenibacillus methanolicus TaxID=582686 RepID=A0A5S5CI93_9BACL|nr:hypothetical protein [Paenibacillus methanolicus]TYP78080.1 hypothetical protein BCM02_102657 [Paenibacillus methanolicus]